MSRSAPHPITPWPPLTVNVAMTGVVTTREHTPAVPFTAGEIAADAVACEQAGASIVHIHARGADGGQRFGRDAYAPIVAAVREQCPDLILCLTSTGRSGAGLAERAAPLELGPELASLTLGPVDFGRTGRGGNDQEEIRYLIERMREFGVRPEFEIFDLDMVDELHRLIGDGLAEPPFVVNLMLGFPNSVAASAGSMVRLVEALPDGTHWSAGARGAYQRPVAMLAAAAGGGIRTGLEDNPFRDHLTRVPATNAGLVAEVAAIAAVLGRPIAGPVQARELLGLTPAAAVV